MTSRIGGDFQAEAVEAFRAAYAQQMRTPENDDVDAYTGLPTDTVSDTSPWLEHTGLWKYPSGKGPDNDLRKPFVPESYLADSSFDDVDTDVSLSDEDDDSEMSDEEIENLLAELRDNT